MTIDNPWNDAALDDFVRCLEEFRRACGGPALRELSRVSRQVVDAHGKRLRHLQELSPTALSDVLNRRRKKPPSWNWVASFVTSCQQYAAESGLFPHPGDGTPQEWNRFLQEWNRRLQAVYATGEDSATARDAAHGTPPEETGTSPPPPGGRPGTTPPAPRPEPLAAPVPEAHAPPRDRRGRHGSAQGPPDFPQAAAQTAIVELMEDYVGDPGGASLSELRFFSQYGRHGVDLLRAAENGGDAEACYRLGLLLCLDDRPTESLAWLMQAETHGHPRASKLIEHPAPRVVATVQAYELGGQAAGAGDHATAEVYLERAVRHGHARAAFELGALCMERHDRARAVYWFSRAAEHGHPLAQWWSDRIHDETRRGAVPAAPPPPGRAVSLPTIADLIERIHQERPPHF
jgi:hypothetical protein